MLPARVQRAEETSNGAVSAPELTPIQRRTILSVSSEELATRTREKKIKSGITTHAETDEMYAAVRYWIAHSEIEDQKEEQRDWMDGWMYHES